MPVVPLVHVVEVVMLVVVSVVLVQVGVVLVVVVELPLHEAITKTEMNNAKTESLLTAPLSSERRIRISQSCASQTRAIAKTVCILSQLPVAWYPST